MAIPRAYLADRVAADLLMDAVIDEEEDCLPDSSDSEAEDDVLPRGAWSDDPPPVAPVVEGGISSKLLIARSNMVNLIDDSHDNDATLPMETEDALAAAAADIPELGVTTPIDEYEIEWTKDDDCVRGCPAFKGKRPGCNVDITREELQQLTPLSMFNLMFTDAITDFLVTQTNTYAMYMRRVDATHHKTPWTPTTVEEMKAFIGLTIVMGLVRLPRLDLYWQEKVPLMQLRGMPEVIIAILRYLHISDRENEPGRGTDAYDKLYKVRVFLNLVHKNFKRAYNPGPEVTVDEAITPTKVGLAFFNT